MDQLRLANVNRFARPVERKPGLAKDQRGIVRGLGNPNITFAAATWRSFAAMSGRRSRSYKGTAIGMAERGGDIAGANLQRG